LGKKRVVFLVDLRSETVKIGRKLAPDF